MTETINFEFLTPQEHAIIGSNVDKKYNKFYVSLAVQDGLGIECANNIRQEHETFQTYTHFIEDKNGNKIKNDSPLTDIVLAPLNPITGETIHDPRPASEGLRIREYKHYRFRKQQ